MTPAYVIDHPRILCVICLVAMYGMSLAGVWLRALWKVREEEDRSTLGVVVSAALTLLGLIIGFTFSMASTRYDQRRLYEEQEANAIGTEWVRVDLMPRDEALAAKHLLAEYLNNRMQFYRVDYGPELTRNAEQMSALQAGLWLSIQNQAAARPDSVMALVVSGMNDVLNSQGYTQFSWWNRIPPESWELMTFIALFATFLVGYATKRSRSGNLLLLVTPLIVSVSFFLIADIDSPRNGMIRIPPRDLDQLSQSIQITQKQVPH